MREFVGLVRGSALAVVLVGLVGGAAQAGPAYGGKVTLPYEVRWGSATLAAGEYSLAMDSIEGPLHVIDASGRVRALVYGIQDPPTKTQPMSLLVTRDGAQRTVRSLNCPLWGRKLVFKAFTRTERNLLASGEGVETVLVRMASR